MKHPTQSKVTAYIGLGSNLAHPAEQLKSARVAINTLAEVDELAFSHLYTSSPMGPQDQPDYVNAVMVVTTQLSPFHLLHALQAIENAQGRVRDGVQRWGARTLDLDLLLFGEMQINTTELTVPHPGLTERAFVMYPLADCAPELVIPGKGRLKDLLPNCPLGALKRLNVDDSTND